MSEETNRRTVEQLLEGLNTRNLELYHAQFHEDSVMEYPQSRERIAGDERRRAVYGAFPSLPKFDTRRITISGDLAVVEAGLDYGDGAEWLGVLVIELRDGKIATERAYFTQPFEPAEWRSQWVERIE